MGTEYIARSARKKKKKTKNKRLQRLNTMRRKKTKMKRKNTKKKNKGNSTKKVQRGGVCPCTIPLYTTLAPYAATAASAVGLYSLKK